MATTTKDPLKALLFTLNGSPNARWNSQDGEAVNISYHFLSTPASYYTGTYAISNFRALNSYERTASQSALANIQAVTNITFTQDLSMGSSTDITFGVTSSKMSSGTFAYAYIPMHNASANASLAGDVWINVSIATTEQTYQPSGYGYLALIHELGHGLGLKHPFEAPSTGFLLDKSVDNRAYTVMSYTAAPKSAWITYTQNGLSYSWSTTNIEPETLMLYDIAALQSLYGANMQYEVANTSYTFDPTKPFFKTLWDAGGTDTIDISNFTQNSRIDLTPGTFSSLKMSQNLPDLILANTDQSKLYDGTNNLAIAYNTIIERAIGGSGNDVLIGNSAANYLAGGAGNDTLSAAVGNDTLIGGDGDDVFLLSLEDGSAFDLTGGLGRDTYRFDSVNLLTGTRAVQDFNTAALGDQIDLEKPLIASMSFGYTTGNPFEVSLGYLKLVQSGSDTLLQWDKDGASKTAFSAQTLLTLKNIAPSSLTSDHFVQDVDPSGGGDYTPDLSGVLVSYTDTSADDKFLAQKGVIANPFGAGSKFALLNDAGVAVTSIKTSYGALILTATTGAYVFTPVDLAIEGLNEGETVSQTFSVRITNGTNQVTSEIILNIAGANDQVVFTGTSVATVTEDSKVNLVKGKLITKDRESGTGAVMVAQTATTDYGSFAIDALGAWQYTLDNTSASVQALSTKVGYKDIFTVFTNDGSSKEITINIKGANDKTTITGDVAGAVTEDIAITASGQLTISDVDTGEDVFVAADLKGKYGTLAIAAAGDWVYTLDNTSVAVQALTEKNLMTEKFILTTAGGVKQTVTVTVKGLGKSFVGTSAADNIVGTNQDDIIKAGAGNDTMTGGAGHDWYEVNSMGDQVIELANEGIDRIALTLADKSITSYTLVNHVENLTLVSVSPTLQVTANELNNHLLGNAVNNHLSGLAGNDLLIGNAGNDTLLGGEGLDILVGGAGLDRLTGGAGADAFVFDLAAAKTNLDVITDMSVAEGDKIYLNLTIFKGLGKIAGVLQDDQFFGGNVAVANTHRILYDNTTGNLWYDADGSGKVLAVQIATLDNKPASLTAADFIGYLPAKVGDLSVVITGVQAADSVFLY